MKPQIQSLVFLCSVLLVVGATNREPQPTLEGEYLGQRPPGKTPRVFLPGVISTDAPEGCISFSFDGRFVVFRRHFREETDVFIMEREHGLWTAPRRAPFFVKGYRFGDFTFSPNELKLYFTSDRPLGPGEGKAESSNLWEVEYADGDWLIPRPLTGSVNTVLHESYPSVSSQGDLFFFRRYDAENGASEVLFSELKGGEYAEPVRISAAVNTEWDEWDPCVSSDGRILVFASKQPGFGEDDLYVSFRGADGEWSMAINLGKTINSPHSENRPFITADNRYLFFSSSSGGNRDIYWVDMEFVRAFNLAEKPESQRVPLPL
jgi:Tol biopolymer transport system component